MAVADGAGEQGGELGLGAAEAVGVGRRDVEGDVDAAAAVGAHAEAAVGAAGERQDRFGAALAGDAEAVAGEREGDRARDDAALANGTGSGRGTTPPLAKATPLSSPARPAPIDR